jgi:hypothetical protein
MTYRTRIAKERGQTREAWRQNRDLDVNHDDIEMSLQFDSGDQRHKPWQTALTISPCRGSILTETRNSTARGNDRPRCRDLTRFSNIGPTVSPRSRSRGVGPPTHSPLPPGAKYFARPPLSARTDHGVAASNPARGCTDTVQVSRSTTGRRTRNDTSSSSALCQRQRCGLRTFSW